MSVTRIWVCKLGTSSAFVPSMPFMQPLGRPDAAGSRLNAQLAWVSSIAAPTPERTEQLLYQLQVTGKVSLLKSRKLLQGTIIRCHCRSFLTNRN